MATKSKPAAEKSPADWLAELLAEHERTKRERDWYKGRLKVAAITAFRLSQEARKEMDSREPAPQTAVESPPTQTQTDPGDTVPYSQWATSVKRHVAASKKPARPKPKSKKKAPKKKAGKKPVGERGLGDLGVLEDVIVDGKGRKGQAEPGMAEQAAAALRGGNEVERQAAHA